MPKDIAFDRPRGMSAEDIARGLTAILREMRNDTAPNADGAHGPWQDRLGDDNHWQLDGTNDYWLHILDDNKANLRCRYDSEEAVIQEVMRIFQERHVGQPA